MIIHRAAEGIDAVCTWVDGGDQAFQAELRSYGPVDCEPNRHRNHDQLRFLLRSILRFAPWVRHIHILTNGQAPPWLDVAHPKVRMVSHADVFPDAAYLPTFNSNAIEMCLHRIPGLSRRFLYFNDDYFLGRRVQSSDFFLDGNAQMFYLQDTPLPLDPVHGSAHDRACAYTQGVLTRIWGSPLEPPLLPAHAPQPYDRDLLYRVEDILKDDFRSTASHRFRSAEDLVLAVLYPRALREVAGERGRHRLPVLHSPSRRYGFLMLENKPLWIARAYFEMLRLRPQFACINDDLGDAPRYHPMLVSLRAFLRLYFPLPSPLEK